MPAREYGPVLTGVTVTYVTVTYVTVFRRISFRKGHLLQILLFQRVRRLRRYGSEGFRLPFDV
jgi:hypothetical protein